MRQNWTILALFAFAKLSHQAALIADDGRFCSGALISNKFVLTRAICVYRAFEVDVILNTTNLLDRSASGYICTSFIIHENYQGGNNAYDIALVQLPREVAGVKIWQLPLQLLKNGDELTLTGFDITTGISKESNVAVDNSQCSNYSSCLQQPESFFSATSSDPEDDTFRNNGSALTNGDFLVGIATHMEPAATFALRITPLVDWIHQNDNS